MISPRFSSILRAVTSHGGPSTQSNLRPACLNQRLYKSTDSDTSERTTSKEQFEEREMKESDGKALEVAKPKMIFEKEFPDYFSEGKFISRIAYVDFIDQALARLKELGLHKNLNAYKELMKVFPPGKYHPTKYDIGMFHAPQQLCAIRILHQMQMNGVKPDREVEKLVIIAFSKHSSVWLKIARMNYWSMKFRNIDPDPLPEELPKKPHQLAKLGLLRMLGDQRTTVITKNTSSVPKCVDKTWVVYCQNNEQVSIINELPDDSTLYIEDLGYTYVGDSYLSYYALKYYVSEEESKRKSEKPEIEFNFNTLKVKFYGKPIREKLVEPAERHYIDGSYVLALGATGTSSHDSVMSWLKIMEQRVPKLGKLNVVFSLNRAAPETDITIPDEPEARKAHN